MYCAVGKYSDLTMVNSSWTEEHINKLWTLNKTYKLYPPCDNREFLRIPRPSEKPKESEDKIYKLISLGQFRPEKDHAMQIRSMFELRKLLSDKEWENVSINTSIQVSYNTNKNYCLDFCSHLQYFCQHR